MKRAERTLGRAIKTSARHRLGKAFEQNYGSARLVLLVLLVSLLLGALLVRMNQGMSSGDFQHAGEQNAAVCWSLVVVGIAGTALAANGVSWGWLIQFGLQPLWIAYAIVTGQHGFIVAALAHALAQLYGFLRSGVSSRRMGSGDVTLSAIGPPGENRCRETL